jgi:hypothetical protein
LAQLQTDSPGGIGSSATWTQQLALRIPKRVYIIRFVLVWKPETTTSHVHARPQQGELSESEMHRMWLIADLRRSRSRWSAVSEGAVRACAASEDWLRSPFQHLDTLKEHNIIHR